MSRSFSDDVKQTVGTLWSVPGNRSVTKFVGPDIVVRATYRFKPQAVRGRLLRKHEMIVMLTRPNARERALIKNAKKRGRVLEMLVRPWPKKRK